MRFTPSKAGRGRWLLAFVLAGVGAAMIVARGRSRWAASTRGLIDALEAARRPAGAARYEARELEGLPAPVQRYFRRVLTDGQQVVRAANIDLAGHLNLSAVAERWRPFTSSQRAVTQRPGFVWDGRIALAPGVSVLVHDACIAGVGILEPSIMGLHALEGAHGTGDIARGELMRYLAEAAWYPTALLPSQGVHWEALNDHSALATLTDGPLSVTMQVSFDPADLIDSVRFEARGATVGHVTVPTPWEGRWSDYRTHAGMRVPMHGEAAWWPASGRHGYFRGAVTALRYEWESPT